MKTVSYTLFALVCFAFNSILCRLALGMNLIDAASFTAVRIVSGALTLFLIYKLFVKKRATAALGNWQSAFFLFGYAVCFSFAYNGLTAGMGALILFGCVQATMIIYALFQGERPKFLEWFGLLIALAGLIYLVSPGLSAPPPVSSALMALAGICWGFYTLRGKGSDDPIGETAGNFVRAVPLALVAALPFVYQFHASKRGLLFAVLSGAVTSGVGYAVWYAALKYHTATRAAILQLSVPLLTAVLAILLLSEMPSWRLVLSAILITGGICAVILAKTRK